ncbi:double-CXXCG motif protein [Stigmatella sp. ncwal1]|uniref:Double-CXXCG motif protein n=1 Tax=Stigmatella ashevillensis TaxID=2995309 RepID=A0ABT5DBC0_9BACT|nr:double-CXXCG motif protein [Stigmatella ashevillena]MDC0709637.1 double-CXXCG motif protein [Stigmatella ashevillena]
MVRFYVLRKAPDAVSTGDMRVASKWMLPGVKCPKCGTTWAEAGVSYPCVDLSNHPQEAEFTKPRAEPIEAFERLRESVRPLLPTEALLPPGTSLGPSVGTAQGEFGAFFFEQPWILFVRQEVMLSLTATGVRGLQGCRPELTFRRKTGLPELVELQLEPLGLLHEDCLPSRPSPCSRCGRDGYSLPATLLLDAASLPRHTDLFRLASFSTVLVGTERFKEAVQDLKIEGMTFHEVFLKEH